jgi:ribosome recycling factor
MIKVARTKAEDAKVSIRAIRRHAKDALDKLVKDGETGEDDVARAEKELEKTTHGYVERVDDLLRGKEAELLEV